MSLSEIEAGRDAVEQGTQRPKGLAVDIRERDVVIVGGGFAGLACAKALGEAGVSTAVVDRSNHHLFQPLLYQVATAALSPADIAQPIRSILSPYDSVDVVMGEVAKADVDARTVTLKDGLTLRWRALVLATGSEYSYFGRDDWKRFAPGLKTIEDARSIRSRLLRNFEEAEAEDDPVRQRALMTVLVIGGGPTGVELAGAVAELARWTLAGDFRHIDPSSARIILVEAGPRVLGQFPEKLAEYALRELEGLGVTVWTGRKVEDIDDRGAIVAGECVEAGLVVWAAGVKATPAAALIGVTPDRSGKIAVNPDLSVAGAPGVYALGDIAALAQDGRPLPALAQVAKQQGQYLGARLPLLLEGEAAAEPFRFNDRGNAAVIGRHAAVFDVKGRLFMGRLAWLMWAIVHVFLLVGLERRLLVILQWIWRYFTYKRGARLIRHEVPNE
jgi:NADH dehydrogenase